MDMVTRKTTGKKRTQAEKPEIAITAVLSESLRLTKQEKEALARALKAAGETFVENLGSKHDEIIQIIANFEL
jgi:hypothetical protein